MIRGLSFFGARYKQLLIHPRQREGQESWEDDVERIILTAEH